MGKSVIILIFYTRQEHTDRSSNINEINSLHPTAETQAYFNELSHISKVVYIDKNSVPGKMFFSAQNFFLLTSALIL